MRYLILQHPGHNRVYYKSAGPMALAELQLACLRMHGDTDEPRLVRIAGIPYLAFETDAPLSGADLELLSGLSFVFALFRQEGGSEESAPLLPLERIHRPYLDEKISSMLKYPGKTNELFTRMMISVAWLSSDLVRSKEPGSKSVAPPQEKISLLDPVAGRGTTLFEGLARGWDSYGIEQDKHAVHEASVFFRKFLETERLKHSYQQRRIHGAARADAIFLQEYSFSLNKDEFKEDRHRRSLGLVSGDCRDAGAYFKKQRFHLLVGDLPYGIAHGNKAGGKHGKAGKTPAVKNTRNPSTLLEESLPGWYRILLPGGTLCLAWNSHLISRELMQEKIAAAGFEPCAAGPYEQFEHRVDQSIRRDIVVARKQP